MVKCGDEMLTAKQIRFIDEYMVDRNGAAAAARAGYSAKCARQAAHETLSNPDVLAALKEKEGVEANRLEITRQVAIKGFLDAFELAKSKADPAAMIAAMRQVGLMLGYFAVESKETAKRTHRSGDGAHLQSMSDAELICLTRGNCQN